MRTLLVNELEQIKMIDPKSSAGVDSPQLRKALADASRSFLEVQSAAMSFIRISTIGELLVFLAAAVLAVNMTRSLVVYLVGYIKCCCNCKNESAQ